MRNYKVHIDLLDALELIRDFNLSDYNAGFCTLFIEAQDPDDACNVVLKRIKTEILKHHYSLENRVLCRKLNKLIRIEKIESL